MEYPKKAWCLYLKGVKDNSGISLEDYDGCIGFELFRNDKYANIQINDKLGFRKLECPKGDIITVPIENIKFGFISKYHIDYFKFAIKDFITNEYITEVRDFWYLYTIFGYQNSLDTLVENKGILNKETIEEIASKNKSIYYLFKFYFTSNLSLSNRRDLLDIYQCQLIDEMPALEAMKRYGLWKLQDSIERSHTTISRKKERQRRLEILES